MVFWTNKDVLVRLEERNRERVYFFPGISDRKSDNAVAKINSKRKTAEANETQWTIRTSFRPVVFVLSVRLRHDLKSGIRLEYCALYTHKTKKKQKKKRTK